MSNLKNVPKLTGRLPGVQNKSTRERNEQLRQKLERTDVIFKAITILSDRLENDPDSVRTADLINVLNKWGGYLYQTISEESTEVVLNNLTTREDAENAVKELANIIPILKAANK